MRVKNRSYPQEFDPALAEAVLAQSCTASSMSERMRIISGRFLGFPYIVNPLIGSATTPELFTVSLAGFDCVTYMETVLALTLADSVDRFLDIMRRIRYQDGQIDWLSRNHYMTAWIRNNVRQGFVKNLTRGDLTASKTRTLSTLDGFPARTVTFKCFPKRIFPRLKQRINDGDLIFFASTRTRLDIFHTGLLFRDSERINLRHASRSQGGVVEQPLEQFLKQNRMAGMILLRAVEGSAARKR